jgi:hypothetical protein
MVSEMERARHAEERGAVLQALRNDFVAQMTSVKTLSRALYMTGYSVTTDGLQFHLALLAASGYITIWRAKEMPGWRTDREQEESGDRIVFARMAPKGLKLIDGKVPEDSDVSF